MRRMAILAGALGGTLLALALAFRLGSASFDARRFSEHQGRLARVMRQQPDADRLTQGLADEGTVLVATAMTSAERERAARERAGASTAEVLEKSGRYPQLRVYQTADMLYFIFFDADGVMRDFTCVSR